MILIPEKVKQILKTLNEAGYPAYVVGGAVRDAVLGLKPHDWDIATNAVPSEVKKLFGKTVDTGIKHGTVTVIDGDEGFEVTTFRTDGKYTDGRHPDEVKFVGSIEEDLARRDFTINALALDINGTVIDPFGGLSDLAKGVIRCVGDPNARFQEDALRMLRAVRFESQFGFTLEEQTKEAINLHAGRLNQISPERIRDELTKMLLTDHPKWGFLDAYRTGITAQIFPEFDAMLECEQNSWAHYASVGMHTLDVVEYIKPEPRLRWVALLHDVGKPSTKSQKPTTGEDTFIGHPQRSYEIAKIILCRLRFSNADMQHILELVKYHDYLPERMTKVREFAADHNLEFIADLEEVKRADLEAHTPTCITKFAPLNAEFIEAAQNEILDGRAIKITDLAINGDDLLALGIQGTDIGEFLRFEHKDCLARPERNNREFLIMRAKQFKQKLDAERKGVDNNTEERSL